MPIFARHRTAIPPPAHKMNARLHALAEQIPEQHRVLYANNRLQKGINRFCSDAKFTIVDSEIAYNGERGKDARGDG
jgi:hypothetical protein